MPSILASVSVHAHSSDIKHRAAVRCGRFFSSTPVSLLLDDRPGYALEVLLSLARPVLVVTPNRSSHYLLDLLDARPEGLLVTRALPPGLPCYLMRVVTGERFYEGPLSDKTRLTPREREVLRRTAFGESVGALAESLGITPYTVGEHLRHIREKLGAERNTELVLAYFAGDIARLAV